MATILIVDDDERSRYYQEALLRGGGHRAVCAANGVEAMEIAGTEPPDALLTDILMPRMDGFELCRRWSQDERLSRRPVVVYTATYTDPSDEAFARQLGAYAFLRKPAPPQDVLGTLRSALDDYRPRRSTPPTLPREVYLETYNAALIRKLADKLTQLEQKNVELAQALEEKDRVSKQRAALEEQLRHAHRLEALGQMAANVAHDFGNLITVVASSLELASRRCEGAPGARVHVQTALQGAHQAARFTRQLLALGRRLPSKVRTLSLPEEIERLLPLLRSALGRGIEAVVVPSREPVVVQADADQLSQVLVNLALNARDAMPDGGRVTLEMSRLRVADETAKGLQLEPGDYAVLGVSDTGMGMEPEVAARVFDPYFTTKPREQGSGLGLATSYGIVRQNGGTLRVSSTPGAGTRFELLLPQPRE